MFNINVHSRGSIELVKPTKIFSLISIIEPITKQEVTDDFNFDLMHSFPIMAGNKSNCFSTLCLRFYDTDVVYTSSEGKAITPISIDQAKLIAMFAKNCFKGNIEELYVNCAAGISRSAGVAAAISKFYTGDDNKFYKAYVPNRYVYMRVLEALHELA